MRRLVGSARLLCALLAIATIAQGQLPPEFFGMGISSTNDLPKISYSMVSHPPLIWTAIEGTGRGVYNFTMIDNFARTAPKDANGVALLDVAFGWTPGWAVADHTNCYTNKLKVVACTIPPDNIQDWIDFVNAVINHYNGITAPHIKYYEIWNEFSDPLFWKGTVAQMVTLAQVAYPILKQDPYAQVMTPSVMWGRGVLYMTEYLQAGGYHYADGLTFHGYPSATSPKNIKPVPLPESSLSTNAPIQNMIQAYRQVADNNGMLGKPLAQTEGSWGVDGVIDPDMQAAWIAHFVALEAGMAASNNVVFGTWFTWGLAGCGRIETSTGVPTRAGVAYQVMHDWLVGQQPQACSNAGNIWSCPVGKNLIVWDTSQTCGSGVCTTSSYNPPPGYSKYMDVSGAGFSITGNINLGVKPFLLEP
jgi:hypothetical protein